MPPTRQAKPPAPTRESVWFVVVWCSVANTLTKTCTYFWNEGRLVTQRVLLPSGFYEDDWYFYDESGSPYGFNFTNSNNESGIRYFVRNLQGDIIESGSSTSFGASHKYDAWGAVTETVLGSSTNAANFQYGYIFGYRGYQYDKETGLYYCQSRYYNPRMGRFVSADEIEVLGVLESENLFLYCYNDPVNLIDKGGMAPDSYFCYNEVGSQNEVHNRVLDAIMMYSGIKNLAKEQRVYYNLKKTKYGSADLVNQKTGEVWELKPYSKQYHYFVGKAQVQKYVKKGQIWVNTKMQKLNNKNKIKMGGKIPDREFVFQSKTGAWIWVHYSYWGNGVIGYVFRLATKEQEKRAKETLKAMGYTAVTLAYVYVSYAISISIQNWLNSPNTVPFPKNVPIKI